MKCRGQKLFLFLSTHETSDPNYKYSSVKYLEETRRKINVLSVGLPNSGHEVKKVIEFVFMSLEVLVN